MTTASKSLPQETVPAVPALEFTRACWQAYEQRKREFLEANQHASADEIEEALKRFVREAGA